MIENDFLRVTCDFYIPGASNPGVMVWDFELISPTGPQFVIDFGADFVAAFIPRYYTPIATYVKADVILNHISLRPYAYLSDGFDLGGDLFHGSNSGAMLPPFVTYSLPLTRANYAMRSGRKAYPGCVVAAVSTIGTPSGEVQGAFTTMTNAWATTDFVVESDFEELIFDERIVRVPSTSGINPTVWSRITGYGPMKFGTQNSRKA